LPPSLKRGGLSPKAVAIKKLELSHISDIFGFFLAEIFAPINLSHPILQLHHKKNNARSLFFKKGATSQGIKTISPVRSFSGWFFSEELKNVLNFG